MYILIASLYTEIKFELINPKNQYTRLFMESKKIFVSYLYSKDFMSFGCLFTMW